LRRKIVLFALVALLLSLACDAWAWNGITHYHINLSTGIEPADVLGVSGTGPDMSIQWIGNYPAIPDEDGNEQNWSDYFHSPNPKYEEGKRPFADKPNFAYLMLKVSEENGMSDDKAMARALGWGGHIAGDWVAHNDNLFPICPPGSIGEKKHFAGECLYELYSFLTKGPMVSPDGLSVAFDDAQIYKALYNYRLITIHEGYVEQQQETSDQELKEKALKTTLPKTFIRQRIKRWAAKLTVVQFAYKNSSAAHNPLKRLAFINQMKHRGVDGNLDLSEMAVYAWTNNLTPRGGIPDYDNQVVPFYKKRLMDMPQEASLSSAGQIKTSAALTGLQSAGYQQLQTTGVSIDEENEALWQEVIDISYQKGYLVSNETETADGLYMVDVDIRDEDGLLDTIEEVINESINSGGEPAGALVFWKRLLLDGISDIDLLTDVSPPELTIIHPANDSFINTAMPELSVSVEEDLDGAGVGSDGIYLSLDGIAVDHAFENDVVSYRPSSSLKDGVHRASISVSDRAGNESSLEWSFTVDTVAPKLCYSIRGRLINDRRKSVEVDIVPNEPVRYLLTIYPVIRGRIVQDAIVFQKEFGQQRTISWDGVGSSGSKVADGNYAMHIRAIDRAGNTRTLKFAIKVRSKN